MCGVSVCDGLCAADKVLHLSFKAKRTAEEIKAVAWIFNSTSDEVGTGIGTFNSSNESIPPDVKDFTAFIIFICVCKLLSLIRNRFLCWGTKLKL